MRTTLTALAIAAGVMVAGGAFAADNASTTVNLNIQSIASVTALDPVNLPTDGSIIEEPFCVAVTGLGYGNSSLMTPKFKIEAEPLTHSNGTVIADYELAIQDNATSGIAGDYLPIDIFDVVEVEEGPVAMFNSCDNPKNATGGNAALQARIAPGQGDLLAGGYVANVTITVMPQ